MKRAISITVGADNLLWLRGQAAKVTGGNLSEILSRLAYVIRERFRLKGQVKAASAHGRANIARFNFFRERGALTRDDATGTWRVDDDRMREAMNALSETILTLQGNGDYDGVVAFMNRYGTIDAVLQADLDRLSARGIPVDVVFEQ